MANTINKALIRKYNEHYQPQMWLPQVQQCPAMLSFQLSCKGCLAMEEKTPA